MDQPTGDAGAKNRTPLFIAGGMLAAVVIAGGLYLESSGEVGKIEKLQVDDSDLGKLRARTLREVGSFEAELSSMQIDTAEQIRPKLEQARKLATNASSKAELEKAREVLQTVRTIAGGQGR